MYLLDEARLSRVRERSVEMTSSSMGYNNKCLNCLKGRLTNAKGDETWDLNWPNGGNSKTVNENDDS